jgi:hypothetical protein
MRSVIISACLASALSLPATLFAASSADDQAMAQQIGSQLKDSGKLREYRIGVKYQDGVAWLNGTVLSSQQRAEAARLTSKMSGVDHVVNNLTITGGSAESQDNGALEIGQSLQQAGQRSQQNQLAAARQRQAVQPTAYQMAGGQPMAAQPPRAAPPRAARRGNMPLPMGAMPVQQASAQSYAPMPAQYASGAAMQQQTAMPAGHVPGGMGGAVNYDNAQMPGYAWPSYASYPNYAALSYPQQYSPSAWPYIGPFYPYPQVPLGWRKVCLEWDDGWWFLDFSDCGSNH